LISGDKELAKQVVLCDKPLISSEDSTINEKLREKLTRNLGHISSLLMQDPDTLIFNNEYELIADNDDDEVIEDK